MLTRQIIFPQTVDDMFAFDSYSVFPPEVMMKAHKEGVAVVGTYAFETAEAGPSDRLIH